MYWLDRTKSFCHLSAEVLAIAQSNSEKYEIVENFFLSISTSLLTTGTFYSTHAMMNSPKKKL